MSRKQKGKQKYHRKQNQTRSRGIAHVFLLITAAIVIVTLIVGFLSSRTSPSHDSKPVSSPSPYAGIPKEIIRAISAGLSAPPLPKIQAVAQLEIPRKVPTGTTVQLKLRLINIGTRDVDVPLEYVESDPPGQTISIPHHTFSVTDIHNKEVWYWKPKRSLEYNLHILYMSKLHPRESLLLQEEWKQVDKKGNAIPPGTYWVQGFTAGFKSEPMMLTIVP